MNYFDLCVWVIFSSFVGRSFSGRNLPLTQSLTSYSSHIRHFTMDFCPIYWDFDPLSFFRSVSRYRKQAFYDEGITFMSNRKQQINDDNLVFIRYFARILVYVWLSVNKQKKRTELEFISFWQQQRNVENIYRISTFTFMFQNDIHKKVMPFLVFRSV